MLAHGRGPLVEMLEEFDVWEPGILAGGTRPLDYLRELRECERALVIHGNYLDDEELKLLAEHENLTLIYCPRTHAYFGHADHPWRKLHACGGRVALGTDSRGSNPDLSLWNELRFLHKRHPDVEIEELLRMGTINGAIALGLGDETGSLSPGKRADLAVVTLAGDNRASNLLSGDHEITATMLAGRWNSSLT